MGEAHNCFYYRPNQRWVPHISLVFREMWDTANSLWSAVARPSRAAPIRVRSLMAVDHQAPLARTERRVSRAADWERLRISPPRSSS
jgi:hypothetical protein